MEIFVIAQWALRALLALYFLFVGSSLFLPAQREAAVSAVKRVLPKAARSIVLAVAIVAMLAGLTLLLPWWLPRFIAGIVLIALLIALFLITTGVAQKTDDAEASRVAVRVRAVVQVVIGALILIAII